MAKYNYNDISFDKVVIGLKTKYPKHCLFTDCRIDSTTVPKGMYQYEIRTDDDGKGDFCTLEKHVLVNFGGTIISPKFIRLTNHSKDSNHPDFYYDLEKHGFNWEN